MNQFNIIINKIDLAPYVGASLEVMERDARLMRKGSPFVFTNLMNGEGVETVVKWIRKFALIEEVPEIKLYK